ncbi:MAG: sirohydrochlorin cobaltochelatase [bacterium]
MSQNLEAKLLVRLQQGLPITARPFARIGEELGLTEEAVLAKVHSLFESGVARRFGAVFESQRLGYLSTLCAADVPASELEAAATRIAPFSGITHCYEREGHPNLWFTVTAPAEELTFELARVSAALGPYEVLNLPALQKFKIEAVFGRNEQRRPARPLALPVTEPVAPLPERERKVVRRMQASIAVSADPFGVLAGELGMEPGELLELLARWEASGVIRRIGLILRHRQLGFSANSMCVWSAPAGRIREAGGILAQSQHVTHCYERPAFAAFPYNLYAMIHAKSREEAIGIFEKLGADAGLSGGRMLWSVREFKKSSPVFFGERKGLLFAVPGTTCPEARGVFDRISAAAARRFPDVEVRWTFTSAPIRRKLVAQGLEAKAPEAALLAMQAEGNTRAAVVSLHLTDGMEFGELAETVMAFSHTPENRMKVVLGQALMASESVWLRALVALLAGLPETPGPQDRVILVAHGSEDPRAEKTLRAAVEGCHKVDPRLRLGMILGKPGREAVVRDCLESGVKKVWLTPCMVAAGYSAQEDIAGAGEHSWATALRRAGIEVVPVTKGLGEIAGIVELWLEQAGGLLGETPSPQPSPLKGEGVFPIA